MVYRFDSPLDQEIVGLVAACLAYGRVAQILTSVNRALDALAVGGSGPRRFLERASRQDLDRVFGGFKHRFTPGAELAALLWGVRTAVAEHGSLEGLFVAAPDTGDDTILPRLASFVERLRAYAGGDDACPSLLSSPNDGSACKRLNLYLRWMVRRDAVDPGAWTSVSRAQLVVPLDTHMFRIDRRARAHRAQAGGPENGAGDHPRLRALQPAGPGEIRFCPDADGHQSRLPRHRHRVPPARGGLSAGDGRRAGAASTVRPPAGAAPAPVSDGRSCRASPAGPADDRRQSATRPSPRQGRPARPPRRHPPGGSPRPGR